MYYIKKIKQIIKNILNGMLIGIVNPIPGVSGGTVMVLLGMFDDITNSISNIFSKKNRINYKDILYLLEVFSGCVIGIVFFSKIIRFLYINFLPQTMCGFSGLILFSVPLLIKNELKKDKMNIKFFFLGIVTIIFIFLFSRNSSTFITTLPINIFLLIEMLFIGFISGSITIFPGISGSMVLLLLGKYYTYNHYLSEITTLNINILIPVLFILIGIILGAVISSKISAYLLRKYQNKTMSLIIGFLFASGIVIIPFNYNYNFITTVSSLICFILGCIIVNLLNKLRKK